MSYFKLSNEINGAYSVTDYDIIDLFETIKEYCGSQDSCKECLFNLPTKQCFFGAPPEKFVVDTLRKKVENIAD